MAVITIDTGKRDIVVEGEIVPSNVTGFLCVRISEHELRYVSLREIVEFTVIEDDAQL